MKQFLIGLFTGHVVTKVVSLLLAIVLFVFVQQSISETRRIEKLEITFELSADLDGRYVLLDERVVVKDMTLTGLRETLARQIAALRQGGGFRFRKIIDEEFLRLHPPENGIVIDAALCRKEGIPWQLGKDFEMKLDNPPTLRIVSRVNRTLRPQLSDAMMANLELPDTFKFVRTGSILMNDPRSISVSGPESAMPPDDVDGILPLYVTIRPLREVLASAVSEADARASIPIDTIDWTGSGFPEDLLGFIRIEQPNLSKRSLKEILTYTCSVELRRVRIRVDVPLEFLTNADSLNRESLLSKDAELALAIGLPVSSVKADKAFRRMEQFDLEVTPAWATEAKIKELATLLILEVDFASAEVKDVHVTAPIRLRARANAPLDLLSAVRIAPGTTNESPAFRFTRKKP